MPGVTVSIAPEILNWIIQKVQFQKVNSSVYELLNKWLSGEKEPTFNQVEDMSKKTNIPFGYFFLDKPPVEECKVVEYRTVDSISLQEPSRNLIDVLDMMSEAQEWMVDYLKDNGYEPLEFVGRGKRILSASEIAHDIRKELGLNVNWYESSKNTTDSFRYLRSCFENKGIMIMMSGIVGSNTRRKLDVDEFRAFTIVNEYAPLIFINTCDSENGKLFSLLHEIAHVWLGEDSFYNEQYGSSVSVSQLEQICNAVAAEILVPNMVFIEKWIEVSGTDLEKIEALAKFFKCSKYVVTRRACDNGNIDKDKYNEIVSLLVKNYHKWREEQKDSNSSGGDYYRTLASKLDHRFVKALEQSAKAGRTQYTEIYRLTNTNRKTFSRLVNEIGGVK